MEVCGACESNWICDDDEQKQERAWKELIVCGDECGSICIPSAPRAQENYKGKQSYVFNQERKADG